MENSRYVVDGNKAAKLISNQIYDPISAIVEEVANYYDADSTNVNIDFTEIECDGIRYINTIKIYGDGEGFSFKSLKNLNILANSSKKEDLYTSKFRRVKLGSYGIAFASLSILGDKIDIYSKSEGKNIYKNITIKDDVIQFSDVIELDDHDYISYGTGCTIVIKNCKIPKEIFFMENILQNKLSFLPLGNNFKIKLCNQEIKRFEIDYDNSYKCEFNFNINNINFHAKVFYSCETIKKENSYYRGVFLVVNKRIIDWNIFDEIADKITTSGSTSTRIHGYITVEDISFTDKLKASRDGITDYSLSFKIASILKKHISGIHRGAKQYYNWDNKSKNLKHVKDSLNKENTINNVTNISQEKARKIVITEQPEFHKFDERKEKGKKRLTSYNKDLKRLGVKFYYNPETEEETIIIAVQLWQLGLLDINLIQVVSDDSPDSVIVTKNGDMKFLEFEKTLSNFFTHNHKLHQTNYILCWDVNLTHLKRKLEKTASEFAEYVKDISYDNEACKFKINNRDGSSFEVEVYILSKMIKNM